MQNLATKILCIFVTGGAYAPYAPCLSTPLLTSCKKSEFKTVSVDGLGSGMGKW